MEERILEDEGETSVKKTKSRKNTKHSVRAAVQSARSFKVTAAKGNAQAVTPMAVGPTKRKLTLSETSILPNKP